MATSASENTLHLWRSRVIDAFAHTESAIDDLLKKLNCTGKGDLIGAKIERLRKAKPTGGLPEERKAKVDTALAELSGLLPLRNDIVHAPMIVRKDGEHAIACFANPNLKCDFSAFSREITAPRMQALAGKVAHLSTVLATA